MQSHTGVIKIFPAIPDSWEDARFENLRTVGAFLVSAVMEGGKVLELEIHSEKGGTLNIQNPFGEREFETDKECKLVGNTLELQTTPGETITIRAGP